MIILIRLYQLCLAPFIPTCCRFYPSCSHYAIEAYEKHGFWKGTWYTTCRLLKCGPWHKGGVDLVKEPKATCQDEVCLKREDSLL